MRAPGKPAAPEWQKIPTILSDDNDVREWMKTHLRTESPRRRWQTQKAGEKLWFYLGRQWIEPMSELAPGNGAYHYREIYRNSNASFPRPVTNLIAPSVDNEVSRLARKEYVPDTAAGKNNPEWMAASRLAKDILMHEISKQVWDDKREELIFNLVIDSIAICRTWWDENDVEVTLVASPDAVKCDGCGRYFASNKVPRAFASTGIPGPDGMQPMFHSESLEDVELTGEYSPSQLEAIGQVRMRHCPYCENLSALKPFEMSEREAQLTDPFGRQMGLNVPRGEGLIDVVSIHEYFPENGGIGVEPHQQKIFSQISVKPLEWIALRFPELRDDIDPEDPALLLRYNPLYADQIFQGQGNGFGFGAGYETYYNHARVHEVIMSPQPIEGLEKGAHLVMVNDKVVRRDLCVEVEGEQGVRLVPRVKYHFARFKRIPRNFWGRSFVDDMLPLQRRLNELDAQVVDLRERGKPNMWVPEGTELYTKDDVVGSLNVIEYDAAAAGWSPREGLFPGIPLTGAVYGQERQDILRDMQALGAPQDIEMGQAPGSVKTTSGLMLLSEEASQRRAPRERALLRLYESAFEHFLQLNWAFRKEDATYEVQREGGIFERESYTGTDLLGDIRVKMSARVNYDQTLYNKEAAAEALQLGLYRLDSPDAVDRILDLMKLPKDVNEKQTLQINRAEMVWTNFMKMRETPPIDSTMDDPMTWYAVLGKRWQTDEAYALQRRSGWPALLPRLVLWPQKMAEIEAQEAVTKPIYGNLPPEQWQEVYQQGVRLVRQAMAAFQQAQASYQQIAASTPPGQPPPMPPPPPPMQEFPPPPPQGFLPDPLEQKIYTVWRRMLPEIEAVLLAIAESERLGDIMEPPPEAAKIQDLEALMRMRSLIEAYRLMASGYQPGGMAGMGAPGAPPGGPGAPPPPPGAPGAAPGGPGPAAAPGPAGA